MRIEGEKHKSALSFQFSLLNSHLPAFAFSAVPL